MMQNYVKIVSSQFEFFQTGILLFSIVAEKKTFVMQLQTFKFLIV